MLELALIISCLTILSSCSGRDGITDDGTSNADSSSDSIELIDEEADECELDGMDESENQCADSLDCADGDPCTLDTCDVDWGVCVHDTVDSDGDGYAASEVEGIACEGPDCDDAAFDVHPGADPDCTGVSDADCDGHPDPDEDGDGYLTIDCSAGDDCDDSDSLAFPGSTALDCDLDRDCNGHIDGDNDGDGQTGVECGGMDCDDTLAQVHWGASEINCDGIDDDCSGEMSSMEDYDQDGYANGTCASVCSDIDCDDLDASAFPGATEICDTIDQDCDGTWSEAGADDDVDGFLDSICDGGTDCDDMDDDAFPGSLTLDCGGGDNDCNGIPDYDNDADGHPGIACGGGDDCFDDDASRYLPECTGINPCCDGCNKLGCWYDLTTGYMWEDPPLDGYWHWAESMSYCDALSLAGHGPGEWHLPTIDELRTLVRGCPQTMTGGTCGITQACLDDSCWDSLCDYCTSSGGPGVAGCYWDPALEGECWAYWSSSEVAGSAWYAWYILFTRALVYDDYKDISIQRRCVRYEP